MDSRELSAQLLLTSQGCPWPSHCQILGVSTSPYGPRLSSTGANWTHSFHKALGFPPVWQAAPFQSYLLALPLLSNLFDAAVFRAHSSQSSFSLCIINPSLQGPHPTTHLSIPYMLRWHKCLPLSLSFPLKHKPIYLNIFNNSAQICLRGGHSNMLTTELLTPAPPCSSSQLPRSRNGTNIQLFRSETLQSGFSFSPISYVIHQQILLARQDNYNIIYSMSKVVTTCTATSLVQATISQPHPNNCSSHLLLFLFPQSILHTGTGLILWKHLSGQSPPGASLHT